MKCRLCQLNETEEDSHIIPAFAYRWMRKKSPTSFFRLLSNPDQRTQDGVKHHMLCPSCEDLFSQWETQFSNQVFQPIYVKDNPSHRFSYEEWFLKFAVSISWRSLTSLVDEYPDYELHKKTELTLRSWSDYLLNKTDNIEPFDQHFLVLDQAENTNNNPVFTERNTFCNAAICFNTVHNNKDAYIFTKICNLMIMGVIYETNPVWENTQILKKGEYCRGKVTVPKQLALFLNDGVERMLKARNDISDKQSDIIGKSMKT